jgi:protocatechuate 3,4-dioxygenase beta subunit
MRSAIVHSTSLVLAGPVAAALLLAACADAQVGDERSEPEIGDVRVIPCEGCEAALVGMPDYAAIPTTARIAPEGEPGEPLVVRGTVYDEAGEPAPGIVIYAYHTDTTGVYPPDERYEGWARRHGRLRGWVRTDSTGRYRFDTIRPASYPSGTNPQHVHMHIIEPDCCAYWISSVHFTDDPLVPSDREPNPDARGGNGLVTPRLEDGVWYAERDIWLGRSVDGYR